MIAVVCGLVGDRVKDIRRMIAVVCGSGGGTRFKDITRVAVVLAMMTIVLGCGRHKEIHDEDIVAAVATHYYQFLIDGNYEAYVDVTYRATPLTPAQRQEWIDNLQMFAAQQKIASFAVTSVTIRPVDDGSNEDTSDIDSDDGSGEDVSNINSDDGSRDEASNINSDDVEPSAITATADVTIAITLDDNTSQTILLPLVKHNNIWYLR